MSATVAVSTNTFKDDETMLSALKINPSRAKRVINDTKKNFKVFHIDEDDGEFVMTGPPDYTPKFEKHIQDICRNLKSITNDNLNEAIDELKGNRINPMLKELAKSKAVNDPFRENLCQKGIELCSMMNKIPQMSLQAYKDGCPILYKINRTINDFVADNMVIIKEGFDIQYEVNDIITAGKDLVKLIIKLNNEDPTYASGKKCLTKIHKYIHQYITKWEYIIHTEFLGRMNAMKECIKMEIVEEEKVATKSKSQLKKEKAREANKRRAQEKVEKIKRQEKEAKYLEQKRKEAEKKRIAVCRAKRK